MRGRGVCSSVWAWPVQLPAIGAGDDDVIVDALLLEVERDLLHSEGNDVAAARAG